MPTALVTGASQGFGKALTAELVVRGWNVVIDGRNRVDLESAAAQVGAVGSGSVTEIPGDVADPEHRRHLARALDQLGGVDLFVNNASILGPSPQPNLADYPLDTLRDVFEVNVLAPLALIQLALPALRESGGTIVNVTSDAAVQQYEGWGGYGSAKAALEQLSNVLAAEEPEIRVYWFDPGDMRTRMHQEAFPGEDISDRPPPETRVAPLLVLVEGAHPSGRYTADQLLAMATT